MFGLILITVSVLLIWYYLKKPFNYWKEKGVPQTNPWLFVGDNWPLFLKLKSQNEHLKWLYDMFPDKRYFGMYSLTRPYLVIRDPELIKKISVKDFEHFTDHANAFDPSDDNLFSKILFFLRGGYWKDVRTTLSGSFTSSKMKYMFSNVKEASEKFANQFDQQNKDFLEVEMAETYARFSNDVIASVAFGIEVDSFKNPDNEFFLMGKNIFGNNSLRLNRTKQLISMMKSYIPSFVFKAMIKLLSNFSKRLTVFFENVISETIEARERNNIKRNDMINLLLEIKHGVAHADEKVQVDTSLIAGKTIKKKGKIDVDNSFITSQALLFFVAGFDAVSTAMSFGSYELAFHPEIQARLRKEINDALDECNGSVTYEALMKMKYLDMVVSEIMRKWHPTAGAMDRVCNKPYTLEAENPDEKSLTLQKGQVLWLPYGAIQRDPKYWPEPDKFDPERFSDENKEKIVPYTYFPFGVGPRNCIGNRFALLEIKCMFFYVLRKYEFVPTERTEVPLTMLKTEFINTAKYGFWLGMKKLEA